MELKSRIGDVAPSADLRKRKRPRRHTRLSTRMMTSADVATHMEREKEERSLAKELERERRYDEAARRRETEERRREEERERHRRRPLASEVSAVVDELGKEVMGEVMDPIIRDAVAEEMHAAAELKVTRREPTSTVGDIARAEARVDALGATVVDHRAIVDTRGRAIAALEDKMADVSRIHESLEAKLDLLPPDMLAGDRDRVRAKMAELQKATDARTARAGKDR